MTARKCQGAKKALTRLIELPKFCHEDAASGNTFPQVAKSEAWQMVSAWISR